MNENGKDIVIRQLRAELEKSQQDSQAAAHLNSEFIANISLELRTPLSTVIGYSEMLQEDLQTAGLEEYASNLLKILDSANYILDVLNDVLDLSKIEMGEMELFLENTSITDILSELESTLNPVISKNGNHLEIVTQCDAAQILYTDAKRVRQALFKLLSNAGKIAKNSVIILEITLLQGNEEMIRFLVKNAGTGMTPAHLEKFLQALSQTDAQAARQYGSSGLELYLAKQFCQMLGGNITAQMQENNQADFSIILPVRTIPAVKFSAISEENINAVLIIDETPYLHQEIEQTLHTEKLRILYAPSGEEGLKLARVNKPAVIILDIPDMVTMDIMAPAMKDGWAVLSALKAEPSLSKIPIIVMGSVSEDNLGFSVKGIHYLNKPINASMLADKITHCLPKTD